MKRASLKILAAGAALILVTNAVVLIGVYFNRSGEAEARITLTQRELSVPHGGDWVRGKENSGLALDLKWRVNQASVDEYYGGYGYSGGTPDWLDEARMKSLGFDVAIAAENTAGRRRFERQMQREILLVLELDGPAWQKALEHARQNAARHEAAWQANAGSKEFENKARHARQQLQNEEAINSRLFAIDAGLDRESLRVKYPDRDRYLILKARVRPRLEARNKKTRVTGYVSELAVSRFNVPHAMRPAQAPAARASMRAADGKTLRFEATLAVGRRLEPWIEALRIGP
ncbi:MAG: DUF4824 family protein [Sulfuritalea sp.]|nr:DUF4824 family protein [Sulfuritalea sp.]